MFFFFKQKTAYEMRISDWSSDVCSSDLQTQLGIRLLLLTGVRTGELRLATPDQFDLNRRLWIIPPQIVKQLQDEMRKAGKRPQDVPPYIRSEERRVGKECVRKFRSRWSPCN